jgi:hypothetical protein
LKRAIDAAQLLDTKTALNTEQMQLLYLYGRAQQPGLAGQRARLQTFGRLLDHSLNVNLDPDDVLVLYHSVIEPVIGDSTVPDASVKAQLARFFAAKGQLIRHYDYLDWGLSESELKAAGHAAYAKAVELDGSRAEYLTGKGFAALGLETPSAVEAEQCAKQAIDLDPQYAGGFGLRGQFLLLEARKARQPADKSATYQQTVEACEKSVELASASDPNYSMYWVHLSTAALEQANHLPMPDGAEKKKRQTKLLERAIEAAGQARKASRVYVAYGNLALGNAKEDMVWLVDADNPNLQAFYKEAVDAFTEGIDEGRGDIKTLTSLYFGRGRCNTKRVLYSGHEASLLDDAESDLANVIKRDPDHSGAHRWLAKIYDFQKKTDLADKSYEKAMLAAKKKRQRSPGDYELLSLEWARYPKDPTVRSQRASSLLDELSEPLNTVYRNDLVLVKGAATSDPKKAVELYNEHVPTDPAKWKPEDALIAARRIQATIAASTLLKNRSGILNDLVRAEQLASRNYEKAEIRHTTAVVLETMADLQNKGGNAAAAAADDKAALDHYASAFRLVETYEGATTLCKDYLAALKDHLLELPASRTPANIQQLDKIYKTMMKLNPRLKNELQREQKDFERTIKPAEATAGNP